MAINIKPSKKGTFTAAAKKHGKSVQGFASQVLANKGNYSPAMVKKANFARNASKWKHADGGEMNPGYNKMVPVYKYPRGGDLTAADEDINSQFLIDQMPPPASIDYTPQGVYNPAIPQNIRGGTASFGGFNGLAETASGSGKYKKQYVPQTSYDIPNLNVKAKIDRVPRDMSITAPKTLAVPDFNNNGAFKPPVAPAGQSWQSQVSQGLNNVAPFVSNIANSFRRPPSPAVPKSYNPVHLQRVNYGADKAEIDRQIAGQNAGLGALGENQATAVRTANLIQGIRGKNQVSQAEANQNAQISNQEIGINSGIDQQNINQMNQYQDQKVNMRLAQQGQQAANLANAADKYVGIQNTRAQQRLEGDKFLTLSKMYNQGVLDRANFQFDPNTGYKIRRFGGRMKYSAGGMMKVYANGGQPDPPVKVTPKIPVNMNDPMAMINAAGTHQYVGYNQVPQAQTPAASMSGDAMIKDPYTQSLELDRIRRAETQARWRQMNPGVDPNMQAQQIRNTQGVVNPQTGDWMPTTYNRPGRVVTPVGAVRAKYTKGGTMRKVYC